MEQNKIQVTNETITAIATAPGTGGIAIIRISGPNSLEIINKAWKGSDLSKANSHTLHLGKYVSTEGKILDEALAAIFIAPNSFTGENVVELNVHGSPWIQREILHDLIRRGAKMAEPGEFTKRAFLNGRIDLAQAEGIADLIAATSKAAHDLALSQTKGSFSKEFNLLRDKLIEFASLLELELDFSEEDVEFADRSKLKNLCEGIYKKVDSLVTSYSTGSALKNGVTTVIAGLPNAGKSSLLNLMLGHEKAIVTAIPGTTRDVIEDTVEIDGILFRFIDTAGIRETEDIVEGIGVEKARAEMAKANIILWLLDISENIDKQTEALEDFIDANPQKKLAILLNKSDLTTQFSSEEYIKEFKRKFPDRLTHLNVMPFSTVTKQGLDNLQRWLVKTATSDANPEKDIMVTNARHYEALLKSAEALQRVKEGLEEGLYIDFIAQDIREALHHLSTLTGAITSDTLLHSIFSRFCIGK